mmetsp:Transcript_9004/g.28139  ORF Transcript_9004/g.28139 Transcript_9004/m.28139 type:complete len:86 (+) Transcript_9004:1106-1363(+)
MLQVTLLSKMAYNSISIIICRIFDEVANEVVLSSNHFPKYRHEYSVLKDDYFCTYSLQEKLKMKFMLGSVICRLWMRYVSYGSHT